MLQQWGFGDHVTLDKQLQFIVHAAKAWMMQFIKEETSFAAGLIEP